MELKQGTLLQSGKYIIKRVLGQGGFGITYLAEQVSLKREVAVKEFFMKESCERDAQGRVTVPTTGSKVQVERYRAKFLKEAETMASLDHPNIVSVIDVFNENGTVYYVMPFMKGGSLSDLVKSKGRLPEERALRYVAQIASALKYMHEQRHLCHFDVKPANILLNAYDNAMLIDFGISKNYDSNGNETSSTPVGMSEGFAPLEQYQQMVSEFSPASDVYALGATLFYLLMGKVPPSAISLVQGEELQFDTAVSDTVKQIVLSAVVPAIKKRLQSVEGFINLKDSDHVDKTTEKYESTSISDSPNSTEETQIVDKKNSIIDNPIIQKLLDDMVLVEGGTFAMGKNTFFYSDSNPQHHVTLSSFRICKFQVTQELWLAVMGTNPSAMQGDKTRPVENVSWIDCQEFIDKLNRITGMIFRLPTEAEWEFAARGGTHSYDYKYSGWNYDVVVAWNLSNSCGSTHPVGTKKPNELGLYDMSGNVFEWCMDWYDSYREIHTTNPKGPSSGKNRIIRGGAWNRLKEYCRVWSRGRALPEDRQSNLGFRLAMDAK